MHTIITLGKPIAADPAQDHCAAAAWIPATMGMAESCCVAAADPLYHGYGSAQQHLLKNWCGLCAHIALIALGGIRLPVAR